MGTLSLLQWCIIGFIIFAKFAIIIGAALWSKSNQEKKRKQFLAEAERMQILRESNNSISE
jgi:hypothetical protein